MDSKILQSKEAAFLSSDGMPIRAGQSTKTIEGPAPLLHLDVQFDSLKVRSQFTQQTLQELKRTVQRQEVQLNNVTIEVKSKTSQKKLGGMFDQIADSLQKDCYSIANKNPNMPQQNLSRLDEVNQDSRALRMGVDKLSEKVLIIGATLIKQNKFKKSTEERLEIIESALRKKLDSAQFIAAHDTLETKLHSLINEKEREAESRSEEKFKDLAQSIKNFHNKVSEIEKGTLWKIRDCEELLKSRVSEKYVEESIKSLEKRLYKDLDGKSVRLDQSMAKIKKQTEEAIRDNRQLLGDRLTQFKTNIRAFQERQEMQQLARLSQKVDAVSLKEMDARLKEQKSGFEIEINGVYSRLQNHEDRLNQMIRKLVRGASNQQSTLVQMNELTASEISPSKSKHRSESPFRMSPEPRQMMMSPHDMSRSGVMDGGVDAQRLKSIEDELKRMKKKQDSMLSLLETKVEASRYFQEISSKIEREEVLQLIPDPKDFKSMIDEIMLTETQKLVKTVTAMTKSLDLKIVKLRNDVNLPKLNRILKQKADLDTVANELEVVTGSIQNMEGRLSLLALEQASIGKQVIMLQEFEQEIRDIQKDSLVGKRNIQCISCGRGDLFYAYHSGTKTIERNARAGSISHPQNQDRSLPTSPSRFGQDIRHMQKKLMKAHNANIIPTLLQQRSQQVLTRMAGGQFKLNKTAFTESNQDLVDVSQDEILNSYVNDMMPRHMSRQGSSARASVIRGKRASSTHYRVVSQLEEDVGDKK